MSKRENVIWAKKLLRTKNFVVLTDTESVISMKGVQTDTLDSMVMVEAQKAALSMFHTRLGRLIDQHKELLNGSQKKRNKGQS